ncbi:MAG: DUF72 domain-containing protein [Phycisphaerae bacterium]|nr:DUF72 domain-containing protein [Phycisphaerae bacterium]
MQPLLFDNSPNNVPVPASEGAPRSVDDPIAVRPAPLAHDLAAVSAALPPTVHLGTSSWSFPGWAGIVYADAASEKDLAREGLRAYAKHPLLRAVGIDKAYYAPVSEAEFRRLAEQTPPSFRFLVKAFDGVVSPTIRNFSSKRQSPPKPAEPNPRFLDTAYSIDTVVEPYVRSLGERAGVLVFQFSPLSLRALGGVGGFLDRLAAFLSALPRGPAYVVEIRNRELFTTQYRDMLAAVGCGHCYNVHPSMPSIVKQAELIPIERRTPTSNTDIPSSAGPIAVRWMLHAGERYESAREKYAPFDQLVDEDPHSRAAIADLAKIAAGQERQIIVIVNNKAEGSAPLSCVKLAREIVGDQRDRGVPPHPPTR